MQEAVRVEFVGPLPETLGTCMAHYCVPGNVAQSDIAAQLREYPAEIQALHERAVSLYDQLLRDFGGRILPRSVMLTSARGLWLSLRHRLANDLCLVINGRRVVSGHAPYGTIKAAIEEELPV